MKVDELVKQLKPGEQLIYNKSFSWVAVTDQPYADKPNKTHRLFKMVDGELEEVDYKKVRKQLVKEIMSRVNLDKLIALILTESIDTHVPEEVFELIERVIEKNGKVKHRPGCVEIEVAGKRGRHMHFQIM